MAPPPEPTSTPQPVLCWHESLASARTDWIVALSDDGGFIHTDRPLPPGTALFLELAFENGDHAEIDAVAATTLEGGMAVQFVAVDDVARAALATYLRTSEHAAPANDNTNDESTQDDDNGHGDGHDNGHDNGHVDPEAATAAAPERFDDAVLDEEPPDITAFLSPVLVERADAPVAGADGFRASPFVDDDEDELLPEEPFEPTPIVHSPLLLARPPPSSASRGMILELPIGDVELVAPPGEDWNGDVAPNLPDHELRARAEAFDVAAAALPTLQTPDPFTISLPLRLTPLRVPPLVESGGMDEFDVDVELSFEGGVVSLAPAPSRSPIDTAPSRGAANGLFLVPEVDEPTMPNRRIPVRPVEVTPALDWVAETAGGVTDNDRLDEGPALTPPDGVDDDEQEVQGLPLRTAAESDHHDEGAKELGDAPAAPSAPSLEDEWAQAPAWGAAAVAAHATVTPDEAPLASDPVTADDAGPEASLAYPAFGAATAHREAPLRDGDPDAQGTDDDVGPIVSPLFVEDAAADFASAPEERPWQAEEPDLFAEFRDVLGAPVALPSHTPLALRVDALLALPDDDGDAADLAEYADRRPDDDPPDGDPRGDGPRGGDPLEHLDELPAAEGGAGDEFAAFSDSFDAAARGVVEQPAYALSDVAAPVLPRFDTDSLNRAFDGELLLLTERVDEDGARAAHGDRGPDVGADGALPHAAWVDGPGDLRDPFAELIQASPEDRRATAVDVPGVALEDDAPLLGAEDAATNEPALGPGEEPESAFVDDIARLLLDGDEDLPELPEELEDNEPTAISYVPASRDALPTPPGGMPAVGVAAPAASADRALPAPLWPAPSVPSRPTLFTGASGGGPARLDALTAGAATLPPALAEGALLTSEAPRTSTRSGHPRPVTAPVPSFADARGAGTSGDVDLDALRIAAPSGPDSLTSERRIAGWDAWQVPTQSTPPVLAESKRAARASLPEGSSLEFLVDDWIVDREKKS